MSPMRCLLTHKLLTHSRYYLSDGLPRGRTTGIREVIQTVTSIESSLMSSTQGGGVEAGFPLLTEWWSKSVTEIPNAALKPDQIGGMCNITYPVNCTQCVLYADKVELLYWPVSLTWKGNTSSTITPAVLPTTVYHGSTLSYGTAYLSYRNLADIACNLGSQYMEKIVAVPTAAISVVQGWNQRVNLNLEMTTVSLNMASLPPNPAASYLFDIGADIKRPNTMWEDKFDYRLLFPSQIRDVDPAWGDCGYSWEATDDPPIALQSALSLTDAPTSTSTPQQESSSAKPGESADPATVSKSTPQSSPTTIEPTVASSTPEETPVSTPSQSIVPGSSPPLAGVSTSVLSTSTVAGIANAIASALGLEKATTTTSTPSEQIVTPSQQETSTRESASDPVTSVLVISDGQILQPSTTSGAQVSTNPTIDTQSGSGSVTPVLVTSDGQAHSTSTAAGGQVSPALLAETHSNSESNSKPVASVLVISGGQVLSTSKPATGTVSPNPIAESAISSGQALTTIQLLGTSTASAPADSASTLQTVIEGHTIQLAGTNSGIIMDSTSLQPGETTVVGTVPISVGTGFFQANSQTVSLPGSSVVVNAELSSGEFVIGSTTLTAGGAAITKEGHTYSVGSAGLVQDGTTIPSNPGPAATVLANGGVIIGSTTLSVGGAAVTTLGHTYSVATAVLIQDGTTVSINPPTAAAKDSDVVTVLANGAIVVGSTTLSANGAAITTLGHTYSVATGALIRDGTTISTKLPTATKNSDLLTVLANGVVIMGSTTLIAGGAAITTLGHTISVGLSDVVRDGTTIPVSMWSSLAHTTSRTVEKATGVSGGSVVGTASSSVGGETGSTASSIAPSSLTASNLTAASATGTSPSEKSAGKRLSPTIFFSASFVILLAWLL